MITETKPRASFSFFSIIAIICAVLSFASGGGLGFLFAAIAICAGLLGVILALLPNTRGGIVSIFAVLAGVVGIIAAIVKLITRTGS
jgi:hypothetical protein